MDAFFFEDVQVPHIAEYDTDCRYCGKPIVRGQLIKKAPGGKAHPECQPKRTKSAQEHADMQAPKGGGRADSGGRVNRSPRNN